MACGSSSALRADRLRLLGAAVAVGAGPVRWGARRGALLPGLRARVRARRWAVAPGARSAAVGLRLAGRRPARDRVRSGSGSGAGSARPARARGPPRLVVAIPPPANARGLVVRRGACRCRRRPAGRAAAGPRARPAGARAPAAPPRARPPCAGRRSSRIAAAEQRPHGAATPPWRASQSSSSTAAARESSLGRAAAARRDRGREALVVHLDRHADARRASASANARVSRVWSLSRAAQRRRQADDDALHLASRTSSATARQPPAGRRALDRLDRRHDRPRRVAQRAAAAGPAVVEREHAHGLRPCDERRACDRGSSPRARDRLGELARVAPAGLRHRVAPAAAAADDLRRRLDDLAGLHAALTSAGATLATRCTRPSTAVPSTIARVAELALDAVGEVEQRLRVGELDDLGQHRARRRPPRRARRARRRRRAVAAAAPSPPP